MPGKLTGIDRTGWTSGRLSNTVEPTHLTYSERILRSLSLSDGRTTCKLGRVLLASTPTAATEVFPQYPRLTRVTLRKRNNHSIMILQQCNAIYWRSRPVLLIYDSPSRCSYVYH